MSNHTQCLKVSGTPYLYQDVETGEYHGYFRRCKVNYHTCFETRDKPTALRSLNGWLSTVMSLSPFAGDITLREVANEYLAMRSAARPNSYATEVALVRSLLRQCPWDEGADRKFAKITAACCNVWFNGGCPNGGLVCTGTSRRDTIGRPFSPATFNRALSTAMRIFAFGVDRRYALTNAMALTKIPRKVVRVQRVPPTVYEWEAIVSYVRANTRNPRAEECADLIELAGTCSSLSGMTLAQLTWGAIDWENRLFLLRGRSMALPINPLAFEVLDRLRAKAERQGGSGTASATPIFRCRRHAAALKSACKALALYPYSLCDIRRMAVESASRATAN